MSDFQFFIAFHTVQLSHCVFSMSCVSQIFAGNKESLLSFSQKTAFSLIIHFWRQKFVGLKLLRCPQEHLPPKLMMQL